MFTDFDKAWARDRKTKTKTKERKIVKNNDNQKTHWMTNNYVSDDIGNSNEFIHTKRMLEDT